MDLDVEVVIVGFGPVGATLAGLLGRRGVRVIVVERDLDIFPLPRAAHIDHTGLRTIQELGCLDAALPGMVRNQSLDLINAEHELLVRVAADQQSISNLPLSMYFYQPDFDRRLRETAGRFASVDIRLGVQMTGLEQDDSGVVLHVRDLDGKADKIRAAWAVGCDGSWSPVREAIGVTLDNLGFDEQWLVLDLLLTGSHEGLPLDRVLQVCDPARPHLSTPISESRQRFEFMLLPGEDPEAMKQASAIQPLLMPWLPPDRYEISRATVYTFHGLVAHSWRQGRVLIAGDAAHQMPPFLGQGMCSGIRDATNLAWKLDQVIKHNAPMALLDSYETERSPHVREVVEAAIAFGRVVCETNPERAQERDRRFLAPDGSGTDLLSFRLPRLNQGPLVLEGGGGLFPQPMMNGILLDDVVGQRFFILSRTPSGLGSTMDWWLNHMNAYVASPDEAKHPALLAWLDRNQTDVVVVRPDRYVLGIGKTLGDMAAACKQLLVQPSGSDRNAVVAAASMMKA
jgi:3-(3-hydroxy-phenyl)propionate hydroxylase